MNEHHLIVIKLDKYMP